MHCLYRTEQLADLLAAEWIQQGEKSDIYLLLTDSRSLNLSAGVLFFAIPGLHHNGHDFIAPLYEAGVRHFVISQMMDVEQFPAANFFLVERTITALHTIAKAHRARFDLPVIGITGSNGKTIVKEWLFQLLHPLYAICRSPKSYNSQIGVPLSVWQLTDTDELGIFEAGISQPGEMEKLAPLVQPQIGLFTNIGAAHSEGFSGNAQKIEEKSKLFAQVNKLAYCKDHTAIDAFMAASSVPLFTWGWHEQADLKLTDVKKNGQSTVITAQWDSQQASIQIPFTDEISLENAMHCWAIMLLLKIPQATIRERMLLLESVAMRMEVIEGVNDCIVINDSYNADLTGLKAGLNFINQQYHQYDRTLIVSSLLESGYTHDELLHKMAALAQTYELSRIIAIGDGMDKLKTILPRSVDIESYTATEAFLDQQANQHFRREVILVKGARAFGFERIARRLSQKVHQTRLEIDVNALIHNIRVYKSFLEPETQMMIMVKAAAYGSGSLEVARALGVS
jgi:UDP-N-acetylmuramoyl-tripeptide--D-alanyl-D-alanine ligase